MKVRILTNYGLMVLDVDAEKTPLTAANFLHYVKAGFYDNTLFHRVISGKMIQGGGLERGMYLKTAEEPIANEAATGSQNQKFTVAMARLPMAPHSATSQFFINVEDNNSLDYTAPTDEGFGYCVFGRVVEGAAVAVAISEVKTGERSGYKDVPEQDVVIESAECVEDESAAGA